MRVSEVSRRYAKALISLSNQPEERRKLLGEMTVVSEAINKDTGVAAFFSNPIATAQQKMDLIKNAFSGEKLSENVLNTLLLLAENKRLSQIGEITAALQEAIDVEEGVTRGVVRAARPLSESSIQELEERISKTLGKKIVLKFKEDPKVLGGLIANVGGWTFDDSLETHLKKLNEELNRSAN